MGNSATATAKWVAPSQGVALGRFLIHSESSDREYVIKRIDRGPNMGCWTCSCQSWKSHKRRDAEGRTFCKHLDAMGLKGPIERVGVSGKTDNSTFTDAAYTHYDPATGWGNREQWVHAAEAAAAGKGQYHGSSDESKRRSQARPGQWADFSVDFGQQLEDLLRLGLLEPPADVEGLKSAMRKKALELHPDRGGNEKAFIAMMKAYERLLDLY